MTALKLGVLAVAVLVASCERNDLPPLTVSDVVIFAALPGRTTSVAYMNVHNNSGGDIVLTGASSREFGRVEIHETVIDDGIARMRKVDAVPIPAGGKAGFVPGGLHMMLLDPGVDVRTGSQVSLEIRYDDGGLLMVQAQIQARAAN